MTIFVTVGYAPYPFDRLIRAVDTAKGEGRIRADIFIQSGECRYKPRFCSARAFLDFDEMLDRMKASDIIVTHAGVGSVLMAFWAGRTPLLCPRQAAFREHVDDHQQDFARAMEARGSVVVAWDGSDIAALIRDPRLLSPPPAGILNGCGPESLEGFLRETLENLATPRGRRRP